MSAPLLEEVVDVGGGHGAFVGMLLRAHPRMSGVVFDLAKVVEGAPRRLAEAGLADRTCCVAGDFFGAIPGDADLYVLKSVLHNRDDAAATRILHGCPSAMQPGARLMIVERVVPVGNAPSEAKRFDINMPVMVCDHERSPREYGALLQATGFALTRILPAGSPMSLSRPFPRATDRTVTGRR